MQRTLDETKHHQATLNALVEAIRDDDTERLTKLYDFIRTPETIREVLHGLPQELRKLADEGASSKSEPGTASSQFSEAFQGEMSQLRVPLLSDDEAAELSRDFQQRPIPNTPRLSVTNVRTPGTAHAAGSSPIVLSDVDSEGRLETQSENQSRLFISRKRSRVRLLQSSVNIRIQRPFPSPYANPSTIPLQHQYLDFRIPIHLVQPLHHEESAPPVSSVFSDFLNGARRMLDSGTDPAELFGEAGSIVVDLFFRDRSGENFTCCSWASEVQRQFPEFDDLVRLAQIALLCRLMRVGVTSSKYFFQVCLT